jgi:hypothetical protein
MKCPNCLSTMYCASEQHDIGNNGKRMDLHCWNSDCPSVKAKYGPHMGILAYPMHTWICNSYHFPFLHKEKWYTLVGEPNTLLPKPSIITIKQRSVGMSGRPIFVATPESFAWKHTALYELNSNKPPLITIEFIPLSTDNDMHQEAEHTFRRLMKLVPFT